VTGRQQHGGVDSASDSAASDLSEVAREFCRLAPLLPKGQPIHERFWKDLGIDLSAVSPAPQNPGPAGRVVRRFSDRVLWVDPPAHRNQIPPEVWRWGTLGTAPGVPVPNPDEPMPMVTGLGEWSKLEFEWSSDRTFLSVVERA